MVLKLIERATDNAILEESSISQSLPSAKPLFPMDLLKLKFCVEYSKTLGKYGLNRKKMSLLTRAQSMLKDIPDSTDFRDDISSLKQYINRHLNDSKVDIPNSALKKEEINDKILDSSSIIGCETVAPFSLKQVLLEQYTMSGHEYYEEEHDYQTDSDILEHSRWLRPHEFYSSVPSVVQDFLAPSVKQNQIADCPIISAIISCANHMCIYGSTFLKDMIYPKDEFGNPLYNPYGKYIIKFYVNGCYRSVIIDDKLLVRSHSLLISGQSLILNEMWVSLIEKAALKIYGGYNIKGYYAAEVLSSFTGWIVREFHEEDLLSDFKSVASELCDYFNNGDIIMTISTIEDGPIENDLVYHHNYPMREYRGDYWLLIGNSHGVKGKWGSDNPIWNNSAFREYMSFSPELEFAYQNVEILWINLKEFMPDMEKLTVGYNNHIYPYSGSLNIELPGLIPRLPYFREQYLFTIKCDNTKNKISNLAFEIEEHTEGPEESVRGYLVDIVEVEDPKCKRLINYNIPRTYYLSRMTTIFKKIEKSTQFILILNLRTNSFKTYKFTLKTFYQNLTLDYKLLSMQRYDKMCVEKYKWKKEFEDFEFCFYPLRQFLIKITNNQMLFFDLSCEKAKIGGRIYKIEDENRVFCDGKYPEELIINSEYERTVIEHEFKEGNYVFIPYIRNSSKNETPININIQSPTDVRMISFPEINSLHKYNINDEIDYNNIIPINKFTKICQYRVEVLKKTNIFVKCVNDEDNDNYSVHIYKFDSEIPMLDEDIESRITKSYSNYSIAKNVEKDDYILVLVAKDGCRIDNYNIMIWTDEDIKYSKIDLSKAKLLLSNSWKEIINTFRNHDQNHSTCDNQWNISIPKSKNNKEEKSLLLLECKSISHIKGFQVYKVEKENTHIFQPTDYEMIKRFPGREGHNVELSLSPGYYTLLPILEPCKSVQYMALKCRGECEFEINEINKWTNIHISDEWDDYRYEAYSNILCAPQYLINIPTLTSLYIYINTDKDIASQLSILKSDKRINFAAKKIVLCENESYHYGNNQLTISEICAGKYILCASSYHDSKGKYDICIQCANEISVERCKYYDEYFNYYIYEGKWLKSDNTAAGCSKYGQYDKNPKIRLTIPTNSNNEKTNIILGISANIYKDNPYKCSMYRIKNYETDINNLNSNEAVVETNPTYYKNYKYIYSDVTEIDSGCNYMLVPSTFDPKEGEYTIHLYTSILLSNSNNEHWKLIPKNPRFIQKCNKIDDSLILQQSLLFYSKNSKIMNYNNRNVESIKTISLGIKNDNDTDEERNVKDEEIKLLHEHIRCLLSEREELKSEMMKNALDSSILRRNSSIQRSCPITNSIFFPMKAIKDEQNHLREENERLKNENEELKKRSDNERGESSISPTKLSNERPDNDKIELEEKVRLLNNELSEIKKKYDELKTEINNSNLEKDRLNNTISLLRSQIKFHEKDTESKKNYEMEIERLKERNNELQNLVNDILNNNKVVTPPPPPPPSSPPPSSPPPSSPPPIPFEKKKKITKNEIKATPIVGKNRKTANTDVKSNIPPYNLRKNNNNDNKSGIPRPRTRSLSEMNKEIPPPPSLDNVSRLPKPTNLRKGVVNNVKKENNNVVSNSPIQTKIKRK